MKPNIWAQLKNMTADDFINALEKDGWIYRGGSGSSSRVYTKDQHMVSIHYHSHQGYGPDQLRDIFKDTGWTEQDLKKLKLIK
jgi:predicted RNA binding protein YcfA (HicA-like mRNA interferase family)